ncbi:hypothetical protein PCASD_03520 [Puccinia coronata f. sp. avenae]|uniref:Phosphodiesterase n=1 Tax=Puccinia coronata f. sp. avenae TaxID=200324 RepID=A0A2N5V7R3_9BASI|nr:hypothetical protein PCASD_03520 [Puccinia coronata f. sp. avenae]
MSARSPRSGPPHRTSPQSDSSTPTAITPNPTSPASHASHTRHMASASSFSPLAPTRPGLQNIAIPIGSSDHSSSLPPKPPQLRTMRRMSTPGTQQTTADTSSLVSRRASKLGLDPSSSHGFLDDIVIGGECGLADGGKASGVQAPTSDDWIGHHLSIVLQHSFTVSSPHPIPSATTSGSLPSYSHSHPPNQFLNLCNPSVTEALRNKVSITSLSSFTTSTATDEEEDNETDDVEEADSQDSTASSCYFPNLKEADSAYSSQPRPFTPRSRPTSPLARQLQLPPLISEPPSAASRPELLQILNTWAFDANSLSPAQIRCSLHVLLSSYLKYTPGLIQQLLDLGVENPEKCLQSLVDNLEVAYDQRNAYHNFRHAVDVVQAVYTMLSYEGVVPPLGWVLLKESDRGHLTTPWVRKPVGRAGALLDEMTVWALLLAAAGHDVGHPGLSNAFMVNARTPIAYVFSDGAVLENFHRITFTRMLRDHGFGKVVDGHVGFRQVLVGAVLATDMGRHFPIVEELKRLASKWATSPEDDPNNTTDQLAAKVLITAGLIKCGDISNSTRPHHISLTWSSCLLNEWSRQAALEADLRLPISVVTLDPTEKRAQAKSQIGFTTLFVLPLFTVMEQLSPKAFRPFADNCRLGLKTWQKVVEHIDNALASRDGAASHRSSTSSATSLPAQSQSAPGTPEDPNSALSLDEPTLSPLSSYPPDGLFSQPIAMGSISSSFQPLSNDPDAHSTPKSRSAGWWGGPSPSLSSSDDINAEDSILSSISSSSISTLRDTNINAPVGDVNLTASSRSSPSNLCESGGGSTFNSVSNCELLSPHRGFNIQVSLSHPERQSSASSSSDEGKANSSNDDSSFSSLGSPSSPPRSPYFPSQRDSVSSSHNSAGGLKPHVVRNTRFDSPIHQSPIADQPSSTQRTRDHGMSVDFGLARRNGTRASLPLRKKSYSPHLVNQQVACAKGCGKVTVKCVKCAAESKLRMYRSLSLAKPPLQLRPEHVSGIRALLGQNSSFRQPAQVGPRHPGTFSPLAGLTEEQPPVSSPSRVTLSTEERSWPPYPFRPLGQLDH